MKPLLVIGLGNPLMGDEGIGWHVAERLAADPRLPEGAEVTCGGTDLLRHAGAIEGRSRVVLIDAIQDGSEPGTVSVLEDGALEDRQDHAHHLSVGQAVTLIQMLTPAPIVLLGISIASAEMRGEVSPAMAARMPAILERVLEYV